MNWFYNFITFFFLICVNDLGRRFARILTSAGTISDNNLDKVCTFRKSFFKNCLIFLSDKLRKPVKKTKKA